ncbi:unnamed protein product [Bursaphelenchus xylophilus]|uniref:(pine wood nematode) hypothetical protein n=1 Tax=Bursaphelenchus xylophilus TaxID=6326 RepID=A0A1I7S731_BURXY|nr:unnamed protein product [Bursaphelenchus xylophilus]CAG9084542.1 unnamed protein product [Bursaphelenchus xylophilus]
MSYLDGKDVKPQAAQPLILKEDDKIPLFLVKLWNIVEDPSYYEVIRWDESGYSFHILDPYSFCRNVLPQYFKHNNLNSLIRQLNMYGFRKMTPIERTSLARAESDQDHLEFSHPCFVRDHPELLVNIKRKAPTAKQSTNDGTVSVPAKDLTAVFEELRSLRERQKQMESRMGDLTKENELIWQEMSNMRGAHVKQQQIVTKLVQFMVTMLQPSKRLGKRPVLAIDDETAAKRMRMVSDISLQAIQQNNVSDVLDRLMRDFASNSAQNNYRQMPVEVNRPNTCINQSNGPIISDVTEEMDHLGPPSTGKMKGTTPSSSFMNQYQSPQNMYYPSTSGVRNNMNCLPNQRLMENIPSNAQGQPPLGLQGQSAVPPTSQVVYQAPEVRLDPQNCVRPSNATVISQPSPDPLITSPSSAPNLNISPSEFAEYLNSVDDSIENCRGLIGGHWDDLDLDGLLDFNPKSAEGQSKPSPSQSPSAPPNRHPTYETQPY